MLCRPLLTGSDRLSGLSLERKSKLIVACNPATAQGARDRAVLLLLVRLDCAQAISYISVMETSIGKRSSSGHRKRSPKKRAPLPQDAGDAILNYLEHWRPAICDEHVFLRVNAPFLPLAGSSAVSSLVNRAARRARLSANSIRAHLLRHTAASLLLRNGVSLQTIGNLLRHQSLDTTVLYAKVDVEMLFEIAQPWPREVTP
jgi:site-specific recombinase XerD